VHPFELLLNLMLTGLQRHLSVVSLLLMAGAGLIILEGPVGANYIHMWWLHQPGEKASPKVAASPVQPEAATPAKAINPISTASTWTTSTSFRPSVLSEIPVNANSDPATSSK